MLKSKNIDYENPIEIADGIYWVGVYDQQSGLHCNPYLIIYLKSSETKTPQLAALTYQLLEFWATTKDFEIDNKLLQELVFKYAVSEKKLKALNKELTWRQQRIEEDLAAAAEIQKSLLPQKIDSIDHLAVAWKFQPCHKIGGDIFNMAQLDDDHWGIYMLDVSGHGVPAAMVAVSVFQNLHPQTGRILMKLNPGDILLLYTDGVFEYQVLSLYVSNPIKDLLKYIRLNERRKP
jgi:serine phosphatase RsbU (regulator of sigma subunit)